jgi:hypothetical protein
MHGHVGKRATVATSAESHCRGWPPRWDTSKLQSDSEEVRWTSPPFHGRNGSRRDSGDSHLANREHESTRVHYSAEQTDGDA